MDPSIVSKLARGSPSVSAAAASPAPMPPTVPPELVPPLMHPGMYLYDPQMKIMQEYQHNCVKTALLSGVVGFGMGGLMGMFMASMRYDTPFHTPTPENTMTPALAGASSASTATASTTPTTTIRSAVSSSSIPTTAASTTTVFSAAPSSAPPSATLTTSSSAPSVASIASTPSTASTLSSTSTPSSAATASAPKPPEPTTMAQVRAGFRDMGKQSYSMARNFGKIGLIFSGVECGIEGMRGRNDATNGIAAGCLTGGVLARNAGPYAVATGCLGFAAFSAAVEAWLRSDSGEE